MHLFTLTRMKCLCCLILCDMLMRLQSWLARDAGRISQYSLFTELFLYMIIYVWVILNRMYLKKWGKIAAFIVRLSSKQLRENCMHVNYVSSCISIANYIHVIAGCPFDWKRQLHRSHYHSYHCRINLFQPFNRSKSTFEKIPFSVSNFMIVLRWWIIPGLIWSIRVLSESENQNLHQIFTFLHRRFTGWQTSCTNCIVLQPHI